MEWVPAVAACGISAVLHQLLVVPRLPAPAAEADEPPPDYRALASTRDALGVLALSVLAALLVLPGLPDPQLISWVGYLGAGAALVWVDLRTTWLPRVLNHLCLAQVALGVGWVAISDWRGAVAAVIGGLAALGLFHVVWALGSGFGYGDVRLAAIIGVVAGAAGWQQWLMSFLLGTLIGACWGVVHWLRSRSSGSPPHFAYGPALWLGPVAAFAISGW